MVSIAVLRGDTGKFPQIATAFRDMADARRGTARAEVITAVPLDEARRKRVAQGLASLVGRKQVVLTEKQDPAIIGGMIARVGDRLIDGSTRTRLQRLKSELIAGRAK
jgi:F-type H+-transporting ATPase subunit delta